MRASSVWVYACSLQQYWDFDEFESGPARFNASLNRQLREENLDDLPGGEVRFISVTDDLVLFRSTLEQPIAIGVRGVVLDVDPQTGNCFRQHSHTMQFARDGPGDQGMTRA